MSTFLHPRNLLVLIMLGSILSGVVSVSYAQDPSDNDEEVTFEVGNELTVDALRDLEIEGSDILLIERLSNGSNYAQFIASYESEGNTIYGLLTIPNGNVPKEGHKAIVFNHGFIPPAQYRTTQRYVDYVGTLAANGFVVFKIDMRGHGNSEGEPTGSYFSPGYTIDAIAALKSLQSLDFVDPDGIGMWGHSMAGNLVMRAMLIEPDIKAGVIWAGAVYSYDDFAAYGISDGQVTDSFREESPSFRQGRLLRETYGELTTETPYWQAVSLTEHIQYLENPVQIHHAANDTVVNINYSIDLANVLETNEKSYQFFRYESGGHNISGQSFSIAMQRTVQFFRDNL